MPNSQPNNLLLSLLITLFILVLLGIAYGLVKYRSQLKVWLVGVERFLAGSIGLALFTTARVVIGIAGMGVLLATFLPDLMPFHEYANQNLDLGGIIYLFLWPLLAVQVIVGFIPYSKRWIAAQPFAAWAILLAVGYMAYGLDVAALRGMYDLGIR